MASKFLRTSVLIRSAAVSVAKTNSTTRHVSAIASAINGAVQQRSGVRRDVLMQAFVAPRSLLSTSTTGAEKFTKSQIEAKLLEILNNFDRIKENPAKPQVTLESHLTKDLGLDSLDHVEIIVQLEEVFGYEIPDSDYEKLLTAKQIVTYLEKRVAEI